jgi:hypothetical protein
MTEREAHIEGKYLVDSKTGETLGWCSICHPVELPIALGRCKEDCP